MSEPAAEPAELNVAVFTIMSFAIDPIVQTLKRKRGMRLAMILTARGPRARKSDAYVDVCAKAPFSVPVIKCDQREQWPRYLHMHNVDLVISWGFPWLVPEATLAAPRLGVINLHNSRLPSNRGPNALGLLLLRQEEESWLTCHWMEKEFDTGNILAETSFRVEDDMRMAEFVAAYVAASLRILPGAIDKAIAGDAGIAQDSPGRPKPSEAPLFAPDGPERLVDWRRSAKYIHNQIRAFFGFRDIAAGALGRIAGAEVVIMCSRWNWTEEQKAVLPDRSTLDLEGAQPGQVLFESGEHNLILIQCGDQPLLLTEVVPR